MVRRPRGQLRQDILDTVIELLIDTGDVSAVSIDAVVDRVGCTPPALYYYFPTKNDLLLEACRVAFTNLANLIQDDVARIAGGSLEQLTRRGICLLHWAAKYPAMYRVLFMDGNRDVVRGNVFEEQGFQDLEGNLRAAVREGYLRKDTDPQVAALSLWGALHGFASLSVTFQVPVAQLENAVMVTCGPLLASMMTPRGLERAQQARSRSDHEIGSGDHGGRP
ncbi:MAG: TetR/AcrR family transcriptional regulator [Micropruina sp.]